jgi:hypothetical protein
VTPALAGAAVMVALLLAALARRRGPLPLADAPALHRARRRSRLLRWALALAAAGTLAAVAAAAGRPSGQGTGLLAAEGSTVVVLDMSASVSDLVYREIAQTLRAVEGPDGGRRRIGLVLFSDTAQVALPPGSPAIELEPFIRFFLPRQQRGTSARPTFFRDLGPGAPAPTQYPLSPWFGTFSGGTRISTGLAAAREALAGSRGGRVVLVSDLAAARPDVPRLLRELLTYRRTGLDLRVVALPPATERDKDLYRRAAGAGESVVDATSLRTGGPGGFAGAGLFPVALAALIVLVGLVVGAHEAAAAPLRWGRPAGRPR